MSTRTRAPARPAPVATLSGLSYRLSYPDGSANECDGAHLAGVIRDAASAGAHTLILCTPREPWPPHPDELPGVDWHPLGTDGAGLVVTTHDCIRYNGQHDTKCKRGTLTVLAPWADDKWGLRPLLGRPDQLAAVWHLAQSALGTTLRYTPSWTGQRLMRETTYKGASIADTPPAPPDVQALCLGDAAPRAVAWMRAITEDEEVRRWCGTDEYGKVIVPVHSYDLNAAYVTAAGTQMPTGAAVRWLGQGEILSTGTVSLDRIHSWRTRHDGYTGPPLPLGWVWGAEIDAYAAFGAIAVIAERITWPRAQARDLLAPWRDRLWMARRLLTNWDPPVDARPDVVATARAIVAAVGRAAIGRLRMANGQEVTTWQKADGREILAYGEGDAVTVRTEAPSGIYRPEWWCSIVARANANILHGLAACRGAFAVNVDCIYSLTEEPALPVGLGAGQYKHSVHRVPAGVLRAGELGALTRACREG